MKISQYILCYIYWELIHLPMEITGELNNYKEWYTDIGVSLKWQKDKKSHRSQTKNIKQKMWK